MLLDEVLAEGHDRILVAQKILTIPPQHLLDLRVLLLDMIGEILGKKKFIAALVLFDSEGIRVERAVHPVDLQELSAEDEPATFTLLRIVVAQDLMEWEG